MAHKAPASDHPGGPTRAKGGQQGPRGNREGTSLETLGPGGWGPCRFHEHDRGISKAHPLILLVCVRNGTPKMLCKFRMTLNVLPHGGEIIHLDRMYAFARRHTIE